MSEHGKPSGLVSLLILASLGLAIAGSALAPGTLPVWLIAGGWAASWWAMSAYYTAVRRLLDLRDSERGKVTR